VVRRCSPSSISRELSQNSPSRLLPSKEWKESVTSVERQYSDFDALDYLESGRSEVEFLKDLETLLLEYLSKPSRYIAWLNKSGKIVDVNGICLTKMGERAVAKRMGKVGYERIVAETCAIYAMEQLFNGAGENDVVVTIMPPGLPEEGFGSVSMTNIGTIVIEGEQKKIVTYTIPSRNLEIETHKYIVEEAIGKNTTKVLPSVVSSIREDIRLAASPIMIVGGGQDALNKLAEGLGYGTWNNLLVEVNNGLKLESDSLAESRRVGLNTYIAKQIVKYCNNRDTLGLRAVGNVVRALFALESAGEFLGMKHNEVIHMFEEYVAALRRKFELDKVGDSRLTMSHFAGERELASLWELLRHIQMNKGAQERLMVSSCGGGGWQEMFMRNGGVINIQPPTLWQQIVEKKEEVESYEFDKDGNCRVCGKSSVEVGKLGPCLICRHCDREIQNMTD